MDLQAAREFFVVRPVTDVTPVIFEAIHHVTPGRDHAEQPVRRIEKQRVGIDEQGFFGECQAQRNGARFAAVVVAVFTLPLDQGLLAQSDGIDRPAGIVLRTIGQHSDAQ